MLGGASLVEPIARVWRNVGRGFDPRPGLHTRPAAAARSSAPRNPASAPAADLLLCCAAKKKARKRAPPPRPFGLPSLRVRRAGSAQTRPAGSDMRSPVSARRTLQSARQRGPSVSPRNRGLAEGRSVSFGARTGSPPGSSTPSNAHVPAAFAVLQPQPGPLPVCRRRAAQRQAGMSGAAV